MKTTERRGTNTAWQQCIPLRLGQFPVASHHAERLWPTV
jgi:hypothetical protein